MFMKQGAPLVFSAYTTGDAYTVSSYTVQAAGGAPTSGISAVTAPTSHTFEVLLHTSEVATLGDLLILFFDGSGNVLAAVNHQVVAFNPNDPNALGLSNLDANVASRSTYAGGPVDSVTGNVGGNVVGNVGGNVGGNVVGNVNGNVVGGVGGDISGNLSGSVGGNVVGSVGYVAGNIAGNVDGNVNGDVAGNVLGNVNGNVVGNVNGSVGYIPDVWSILLPSSYPSGSAGFIVGSLSAGADPWAVDLPGSYTINQAGYIIGTMLNARISSRSTYDGGPVASVTGDIGGSIIGNLDGNVYGTVIVDGFTAGAITDSAFTLPAETPGRPTTVLAIVRRVWEWVCNLRERDRDTGEVRLRNQTNTGTLETQTQVTIWPTDRQSQGV